MAFMGISVILTYILKSIQAKTEKYGFKHCEFRSDSPTTADCSFIASPLRMSFALTLFHILILLILIPRARCCGAIHDGFWIIKVPIIIGTFIGAWFIKREVFVVWGQICRAGSIIYLFIQAYFLMNIAYTWNDKLLSIISGRNG